MNGPFVEVAWLAAHLDDPRVRIVDTRSMPHGAKVEMPDGSEQYAGGHIPGAVHLDYSDALADPATPYATRVAPPDRFADVMSANGIGDGTLVIAYDEGNVPYGARMLWMLRYYGHDDVAILAGGLAAWTAAGHAITTETPTFPRAAFNARERPALRASREDVIAIANGRSGVQLLETQRDGTYAQRDQDIPNSIRFSASSALEDARGGRIASPEKLAAMIATAGIDKTKRTITTCGSGVGASGAYLALLEAGFTNVAVYDGSWMEWSHDQLPTVPKTT